MPLEWLIPLGFLLLLWQRRASAGRTRPESCSGPGWSSAVGGRAAWRPDPPRLQSAARSNWPAGLPGRKAVWVTRTNHLILIMNPLGMWGMYGCTGTLCPSWAASPRAAVETGSIRCPISCTEDVSCSCSACLVTAAENYVISHNRKTSDPIKFFLSDKIKPGEYLNSLPLRYHLCRARSVQLQRGTLAQCPGCTYWCYRWSNHTPSALVPCPYYQKDWEII